MNAINCNLAKQLLCFSELQYKYRLLKNAHKKGFLDFLKEIQMSTATFLKLICLNSVILFANFFSLI